jgi:signal transduction histidine kinase
MSLQIAAMLVGLLLVSTAALWGLKGLKQDYGLALAGYHELRHLYEDVGSHLAVAEALLDSPTPDRGDAARQVEIAIDKFDLYERSRREPEPILPDQREHEVLRQSLRAALVQLNAPPTAQVDPDRNAADVRAVNAVLAQVRTLSHDILTAINERQKAGTHKWNTTLLVTTAICALVVLGAVLLGVLQYRSVMTPLHRLGAGVRKIAAAEFSQRLDERGSEEFAALAHDFNRMAAELDGFYHQLEQKVAQKSKELTRSERLASVGFLAAGVAHEINNPLGIIAGYAEYSLAQLKQQNGSGPSDVAKSLEVICEEAFRCKDITGKLLSLVRPGEEGRKPVDLAAVARDVASAVGGLGEYQNRKLAVSAETGQELLVSADEGEMKQVVLNLTINALEAVPPRQGEVRIEVGRENGWVELRVSDNGRGMSPETLEHVFEPFFTEKRGSPKPGTGLGLSITHAIVESHGGRIVAQSPGVGMGSRFVVQLPVSPTNGGAA